MTSRRGSGGAGGRGRPGRGQRQDQDRARGRSPSRPGGRGQSSSRSGQGQSPSRPGGQGRSPSRGGGQERPPGRDGRTPPPTRITNRGPVKPVPTGRRGRVSSDRGLGGDQVEGRQAVRELLIAGRRKVREVWMLDERDDSPVLEDIRELAAANRVTVTTVGRGRFAAQARCEAPQGVLALAAPLPEADIDTLVAPSGRGAPFLVALDGVTDPGNLGAILRSAECAGVTGAILPRHRAVHVTPAATKAAAGAVEHVAMAVVGGLPTALANLRAAGVHVVGLDGAAETSLYDLVGVEGPVCLVLGAEGRGLSRLVRERCDEVVAIPMKGVLGSLNVSAAAALACFEIARHR